MEAVGNARGSWSRNAPKCKPQDLYKGVSCARYVRNIDKLAVSFHSVGSHLVVNSQGRAVSAAVICL